MKTVYSVNHWRKCNICCRFSERDQIKVKSTKCLCIWLCLLRQVQFISSKVSCGGICPKHRNNTKAFKFRKESSTVSHLSVQLGLQPYFTFLVQRNTDLQCKRNTDLQFKRKQSRELFRTAPTFVAAELLQVQREEIQQRRVAEKNTKIHFALHVMESFGLPEFHNPINWINPFRGSEINL